MHSYVRLTHLSVPAGMMKHLPSYIPYLYGFLSY